MSQSDHCHQHLLLFPAVVCPLYTLRQELNFGMGPSTTHVDHSVVDGTSALGDVPAGSFGAAVLCLLTLVMVVALPLMVAGYVIDLLAADSRPDGLVIAISPYMLTRLGGSPICRTRFSIR